MLEGVGPVLRKPGELFFISLFHFGGDGFNVVIKGVGPVVKIKVPERP